jgi:hypothetical protein
VGWRLIVRSTALAARRCLPWPVLVPVAAASVVLVVAAAWRPSAMWPLHGSAVALVFGASAWCADEPIAGLVDVSPRASPWAPRVRAIGPAALAIVWVAVHVTVRHRLPPHLPLLAAEGIVAALAGAASGSVARRRRDATGGARAALVVVPVLVAVSLVRPYADHLPLFPVWPWEPWGRAEALWAVLALGSALVGSRFGTRSRIDRPRCAAHCPNGRLP